MTGASVSARLTPNTQNLRGEKCDSQPEPLMSSQVDPLELMEVADAPSQETVVGA